MASVQSTNQKLRPDLTEQREENEGLRTCYEGKSRGEEGGEAKSIGIKIKY